MKLIPSALTPPAEVKRRLDTCNSCPEKTEHPVARVAQCAACGCFIAAKTRIRSSTCPLNKW